VEVEAEEADRCAGEDDGDRRRTDEPIDARHDEHGGEREERRARGQAVEAIDEVEGVRDADEPRDGEEHPDSVAEIDDANEGQRERRDAQAGDVDPARDHDLHEEFPSGMHGTHVVHEPDEMHRQRTADDRGQAAGIRRERVLTEQADDGGQRDGNRQDDRDAADSRHRTDVDLSLATRVDETGAARELAHDERERRGGANGDDESDEVQRNLRLLRQQESRCSRRASRRAPPQSAQYGARVLT